MSVSAYTQLFKSFKVFVSVMFSSSVCRLWKGFNEKQNCKIS